MTHTKQIFYVALWAIFLLCIPYEGHNQQRLTFDGDYTIGTLKGSAHYDYQVVGIDTIFDGRFVFERSDLDALLKERDSSFTIRGNFEKGVLEGNWLFQFGEFQTDSTTQLTGFNYQVNVNGALQEALGSFKNDQVDGTWRFSQKQIKDSQVLDTLFFSEINFSNGVPQQTFRIENENSALIGRLLRNGLAHDTWSLIANDGNAVSNWYFNEGRLLKIEKDKNGIWVTTPVFDPFNGDFEEEELDAGFSALIKIYQGERLSSSSKSEGIDTILMQNQSNYNNIREILSGLGMTSFGTGFKVLVPHFPLEEKVAAQLDSVAIWAGKSKAISTSYLANTQLNILRRSDEEADYLFNVTKALDSQFVQPLFQLVDLRNYGVLDNVTQAQLSRHLFPEGNPSPELSIPTSNGGNRKFTGPNVENVDFGNNTVESLFQMAKYMKMSLEKVAADLKEKLVDDTEQREFEDFEKQMIDQVNALGKHRDSIQQLLNNRQLKALASIKESAENLLSEYAEKDSKTKTLEEAKELVNCLDELEKLSDEVVMLSNNERILQEKYTDAVFNPFTATIMDERVKKRIIGAYRNVVIPYLFDITEKDLSCNNAASLQTLFGDLQKRMLELRDEDTSKMERKLRKERNPKVVLEMFNLKPIGK